METDWIGVLIGTMSDEKFNQFNFKLEEVLNEIAPIKTVWISAKRCFVEPWMTRGIDQASRTKMKLYRRTLLSTSTPEGVKKYKDYRNTFNTIQSRR